MLKSVEAIYDGEVFRPAEAVELAANTRVRLIFETALLDIVEGESFLDLASRLELDGPEDWSLRLDEYLYALPDLDGR
jgi:predicted DNA-binding antitoxin AbrB/MazE fold protein